MYSPDPFADSDDSFENFVTTPSTSKRRRSSAIFQDDEESIDRITSNDTVTVIENRGTDTVLEEENCQNLFDDDQVDLDDTVSQLLEPSDDEGEEEAENPEETVNDALTNLLKSFRERGPSENVEEWLNRSVDIFAEAESENVEQEKIDEQEPANPLLSVVLPKRAEIKTQISSRKRPSTECLPSTSGLHGPVGTVCSDTGEYWNQQQKSIEVNGKTYDINSFGDYMKMKIAKLNHQVNTEKSKPSDRVTDILKGYSVFVNGFTDPPALVIRDLMIANGGEYHCYYQHGITTYNIASTLATAKINRIREKEIFIKADWITESIAAGKPLDYRDFLIYEKGAQEKGQMREFLNSANSKSPGNNGVFLDARNPNFIRDYYARSRLHLISTLAQDMKDFVANLKSEGKLAQRCFDENELKILGQQGLAGIGSKTVFHVDLDCFFVSVALRDREHLREKEVAITHSKGTISNSMSEIASCSYAARSYGVKNGMLVRDALQHCPQLTLLPYQFDDYIGVSRQIYQILSCYTLELRAVSCDEMYINMTRVCEKYGISDPQLLAEHIRKVIREKTRCPASVGIGSTSFLARLATRHAKPNGVYWVTEQKKNDFIKTEKVKDLPGLGYEMMNRMTSFFGNLQTCAELQQKNERELVPVFGTKHAAKIFKQCRGIEEDPEDFWKTQLRKSVSCDINYGIRFSKKEELVQLMTAIGAELERKLTDCKMSAGSITLKLMVRSLDAPIETAKFMGHGRCDTFTKTSNFPVTTTRGETITVEAMKLYGKVSPKVSDLRGVGVTCGKLSNQQRKNATTAIQEMFGKKKKETDNRESKRMAVQSNSHEDDNEEMDMRASIKNFFNNPSTNIQKKVKTIPHPSEIKTADGVSLPGILKLSRKQVQKSVKAHQIHRLNKGEDEELRLRASYLSILENALKSEPTESSVQSIREMFSTLLRSGKLSSFEYLFQHFEKCSADSEKSHADWFSAFHIMLSNIKEETQDLLGFSVQTIQNRIEKTLTISPKPSHIRRVPRAIFVKESIK